MEGEENAPIIEEETAEETTEEGSAAHLSARINALEIRLAEAESRIGSHEHAGQYAYPEHEHSGYADTQHTHKEEDGDTTEAPTGAPSDHRPETTHPYFKRVSL